MKTKPDKIMVHVKYSGLEETFSGDVNQVWVSINRFFTETVPAFHIGRKVLLTVDLEKLVENCKDIIAVAPEGAVVLVSKDKLTDRETLMLHLLANYVGHKLGMLKADSMSKMELQNRLGKSVKITSTRLGELCREGLAEKTEKGNYKITTFGVRKVQKETLPKIEETICCAD
ncbi:MAG: hypothetical protein U9O89_00180 [Thermoproteota archaeon]|nr:hypothetical protein [Thermoproteota archaeon]